MITVACVLRSGGWCSPLDVQRLAAGVRRHLPLPHRFVCLSDVDVAGVIRIPLPPDTPPGWWAKQLLFAPRLLYGRCLFFDLDSVIVGDLSDLAYYRGAFAGISDFYRPERFQTGIMAWDADGPWPARIWDAWLAVSEHGESQAAFVAGSLSGRGDRLEQLYPGQIVSYKRDCRTRGFIPPGARVICLHGRPRPAEFAALYPDHPMIIEWARIA